MKGGGTSVTPIYAGVRTDIEKLLEKYLEKPSVRYEYFEKCFRDSKFSLIFTGRNTENELREFEEKIFSIALSYCFEPYSYQTQVGAMYLIYALYYTQPSKHRMQIRVTNAMLNGIFGLLNTLKAQKHFDACYVLNRLLYDDAFQICMFQDEHNPMTYRRFDGKNDAERAAQTLRNGKSVIDELLEDRMMEHLEGVHEQYLHMKAYLFEGEERLPQSLRLLAKVALTDYVKSALKDCEEKLERRFGSKSKKRQGSDDASDEGSPKKVRRKEGRAAIRERAYATVTNQGRFRRKNASKK